MTTTLRVALIGGPQYDHIGEALASFTAATGVAVDVAFRGDHPALNDHLAEALPAGVAYDVVSTHSKYAPSQAHWLRPLDDLVDTSGHVPRATDLCRFDGGLRCVPRNVDVRLLWVRRDLAGAAPAPATWAELADRAAAVTRPGVAGFTLPGSGSGLFGTFYELVVSHGGRLFDHDDQPTFDTDEVGAALSWLRAIHVDRRATPRAVAEIGFDQVAEALRAGTVAMAGDWPAYYRLLRDAVPASDLDVAHYPSGPAGPAVYGGCHGFAITTHAEHPDDAARLVGHLTSAATSRYEASHGMLPARTDVTVPAGDDLDRRRAELLADTVANRIVTFPKLAHFPAIEDHGALVVQAVLLGRQTVAEARRQLQAIAGAAP